MYGRRGRIGLIVPSSNTVCEPEMVALCPEGVAIYSTRILFEPTLEGLKNMKDHVERATRELASENICDLIAFCCTVGSMIGGPDYDTTIIDLIENKSGVKAIATTSAVKAALKALNVQRIAVATPYTRDINQIEAHVLTNMGYRITKLIGYHDDVNPDEFKNDMIGRLEPDDSYKLALDVTSEENEAIFISCTNLRAIEIIQLLEQETGKPVITSNQAAMWHALRRLGINDAIEGYGRLFSL
jgi:maleate isomerase